MARQAGAKSTYRMSEHGHSTRSDQPGFLILRKGIPHQHYKPSWKRTHTVVRFLPEVDRETGQIMPMRDPNCDSDRPYTDWMRRYDCGVGIGPAGITYILCDPTDLESAVRQNPLRVLNMAVANALRTSQADPAWVPYTIGAADRKKQLTNPEDLYLAQCYVLEHNSKPQTPPRGLDPSQPPVLFTMTRTAAEALLNKLAEKDANGNYVYGDILDPNGGAFVDFRQAGTPPLAGAHTVTSQGTPMMVGGQNNNYYEVDILPQYNGWTPAISQWGQQVVQQMVQRWIDWDDALWFPTIGEQVQLLCTAGFPANMILYALGEQFGEYIPPHVRQAAAQRVATHVPGGYGGSPPAAGYGQPNPGYPPQQPAYGFNPAPAQPAAPQGPAAPYGAQYDPSYGDVPLAAEQGQGGPAGLGPNVHTSGYIVPSQHGAGPSPGYAPGPVAAPGYAPGPAAAPGYAPGPVAAPGYAPGPVAAPGTYAPAGAPPMNPGQPQPAPQQFQPPQGAPQPQPAPQQTQPQQPAGPPAQPLHSDPARQQSTIDALNKARERARGQNAGV